MEGKHIKPNKPNRVIAGKVGPKADAAKDNLRVKRIKAFSSVMGVCALSIEQSDGTAYKAGNYEPVDTYEVTDNLLGIEIVMDSGDQYIQTVYFYHRDGKERKHFGAQDR